MNCLRYHPSHGQITIKHFRLHRRYSSHTAFYELTQFHRRKCPILCCWLTSKKKPFTSLVFADARARARSHYLVLLCAILFIDFKSASMIFDIASIITLFRVHSLSRLMFVRVRSLLSHQQRSCLHYTLILVVSAYCLGPCERSSSCKSDIFAMFLFCWFCSNKILSHCKLED